jgi:hypothetical protein
MHTRLQNGHSHSNNNSRHNSFAHIINSHNSNSTTGLNKSPDSQALVARRPSILLQEILSTRRPSAIMHALTRPSNHHPSISHNRSMLFMDSFQEGGSSRSINIVTPPNGRDRSEMASMAKKKNRRVGDDALTASLSALYAKLIVILGCAMPITEILSTRIPTGIYQGFYIYLYAGSIAFVLFTYATHMKSRAVSSMIKSYRKSRGSEIILLLLTNFCRFRAKKQHLPGKKAGSTFRKFLLAGRSARLRDRDYGVLGSGDRPVL